MSTLHTHHSSHAVSEKHTSWLYLTLFAAAVITAILFHLFIYLPSKQPIIRISNTALPVVAGQHTEKNADGHNLLVNPSNQWYSSAIYSFPTQPLYAFPLAFRISADGLGISSPPIKKEPNTIFASYDEDFNIGIDAKLRKPKLLRRGDWSVSFQQSGEKGSSLSYTLAQGAPFTTLSGNSEYIFSFSEKFNLLTINGSTITKSAIKDSLLLFEVKGNYYMLASKQSFQTNVQKTSFVIKTDSPITIVLLDEPARATDIASIAGIEILDTQSHSEINGNILTTTYQITTNDIVPFITLLPHHVNNLTDELDVIDTYPTLRGDASLVRTSSFSTRLQAEPLPYTFEPSLVKDKSAVIATLKKDIASAIAKPPGRKIYTSGVWLGRSATLIQLAQLYDLTADKKKLMEATLPVLQQTLADISYDPKQKSMISAQPEYGNEKLNDHHFHYGYLIRTAAVLKKEGATLNNQSQKTIGNLISDIMTTDRSSSEFPYIRTFNPYEGHSYADGKGAFADGLNQESTSEALNAWYGIALWGQVTGNKTMSNTATALFYLEKESTFEYWFNVNGIYTRPYAHSISSLVWGGKVDYATWFSNNTNMKYGIQLLPFTPASAYLEELPDFSKYEKDIIAGKGGASYEWGDLFLMWKSFYEPAESIQQISTVKKREAHTPESLFLHVILQNSIDSP